MNHLFLKSLLYTARSSRNSRSWLIKEVKCLHEIVMHPCPWANRVLADIRKEQRPCRREGGREGDVQSLLVSMLSSVGKSQSANGGGLGLCQGADGMWKSRRAWITEAIFAPNNPETLQDFNLALFTMEACNNVIVLKERSYIQLNLRYWTGLGCGT